MPAPDPLALWIEETETGFRATFEVYFGTGQAGNRKARALAILRRIHFRTWQCAECGEALPDHKRADALYCREACRKAAARWRRGVGRISDGWP